MGINRDLNPEPMTLKTPGIRVLDLYIGPNIYWAFT